MIATLVLFSFVGAAEDPAGASENDILSRVAEFHGAAGVFAVAGYHSGARQTVAGADLAEL